MSRQKDFDDILKEIDATDNFSNLGGNVSVALSMLFMKYKAYESGLDVYEYLNKKPKKADLPKPLGNVLGGGLHSNNILPVQEVLVSHLSKDVYKNIENNIKVYHELERILKSKNYFFGKNDEGAISTNIKFSVALKFLDKAIKNLKLNTKIGFDIAASSFYKNGKYIFEGKKYTEEKFSKYLETVLSDYSNIIYMEDPFYEESFDAYKKLQDKTKAMICGDDLFTTNVKRIKQGIHSTKAVLIKPNQIGTLTDTYKAVKLAKDNDLTPVISHRSGETGDVTISHLAVGWKIPFIKTGTVSGGRISKLNELIYINERLS